MLFFEKSIYIEKIFKTFLQTIQICVKAADILWYIVFPSLGFHQRDDQFLNSMHIGPTLAIQHKSILQSIWLIVLLWRLVLKCAVKIQGLNRGLFLY